MNEALVVREAFDWLEVRPDGGFTGEDYRELLAYLARIYPKKNDAFELGYNRIRFINVVGTIRLSRVQIDIVPKLEVGGEDGRTALLNMLAVCGHVPYRAGLSRASVQEVRLDLLTWIAAAFAAELDEQLKRGVPADYVTIEENGPRLKGRLLIPGHIRANAADKTRAYCAFNVRTAAVPLNLMLYKALLVLKRKVRDSRLQRRLQQLCLYYEELAPGDVRALFNQVRFDRQTVRFEPAYKLARLILSRLSVLHRGTGQESLSFLFEVNVLYEGYIGKVLQHIVHGEGTIIRLQHDEVRLLRNEDTSYENIKLVPDIVLGQLQPDGSQRWTAIIDTKWKRAAYQQDDIYQMYAYVTGYRDAGHAVLLYPQTGEAPVKQNWSLLADPSRKIAIRNVRIGHWTHTTEDLARIVEELT